MIVAVRPARSSFIERWIRPGLDAHWAKSELKGAGVNVKSATPCVRDTVVNSGSVWAFSAQDGVQGACDRFRGDVRAWTRTGARSPGLTMAADYPCRVRP